MSAHQFQGICIKVDFIGFFALFLFMRSFVLLAGGLELFTELLQRFPNNIHILLEMAKVRDGFV